jgi:exo-beta-1,3-glucanase (GH17 family)
MRPHGFAIGLLLMLAGLLPAEGLAAADAPFIGVAYGPYRLEGQRPGGPPPDERQILRDLELIHRAGFRQLRTFGTDNGLNRIPPLARTHFPDLSIYQGVYACGRNHDDLADPGGTRAQMDEAVRLALANDNVAGIIVGNECLPGEPEACPVPISLAQLIADIELVRAKLKAGGRSAVDVTSAMSMVAAVVAFESQGRPLAGHCDPILVNIHPFFAPSPAEQAAANVLASYRRLQQLYGPSAKRIVIGETGWPSDGPANGQAVPSGEHQRRFVRDLFLSVRAEGIRVFWFEMFDEPWKIVSGGVGPHWGLFDRHGRAKFDLPW